MKVVTIKEKISFTADLKMNNLEQMGEVQGLAMFEIQRTQRFCGLLKGPFEKGTTSKTISRYLIRKSYKSKDTKRNEW